MTTNGYEPLEMFDGKAVIAAAAKLKNAGDGLSDALAIQPMILHEGDEVTFVVRGVVVDVNHPPVNKDDLRGPVKRVHHIKCLTMALAQNQAVDKILTAHEKRVAKNRETGGQGSVLDDMGGDE